MKLTDLHIAVANIPDAGLLIEGELPDDWAAESLLPAYEARSPLSVRMDVRAVNGNVLVQGHAGILLGFECSRTLEPSEAFLRVDFAELFVPSDKHEFSLGDGVDSDAIEDEPYAIVGGQVDLEQLVREELVLAQDPYPVAVEADADDPDAPVWTSTSSEVDPRWAELKKLKLD
ncbi:MAG: DUF177 domain-containing protein [Myxococcales bacterium]|nr:DUF177 domain-containing protein [Myxococcales bacterium]MCB9733898.1 DUF177 domain-containing protein [Deltaproteobacteria bacterium]